MRTLFRTLVVLAVVGHASCGGACSSPSKEAAGTRVERTKVSTMSGTANASPEAPPPATEETGKCKHAWESMATWTHAWVDDGGELPNVLLCTPIRCQKCGAVRHECARRSGR